MSGPATKPPYLAMKPLLIVFVFLIFWDPILAGKMEIFLGKGSEGRGVVSFVWKRNPTKKTFKCPLTMDSLIFQVEKESTASNSASPELEPWLSDLLAVYVALAKSLSFSDLIFLT